MLSSCENERNSTQLQLTPLCTPVLLVCNMHGFYKHSFVGYYEGVCLGFLQLQLLKVSPSDEYKGAARSLYIRVLRR